MRFCREPPLPHPFCLLVVMCVVTYRTRGFTRAGEGSQFSVGEISPPEDMGPGLETFLISRVGGTLRAPGGYRPRRQPHNRERTPVIRSAEAQAP